jgi:hypothetical protein
MNIIRLKKRLSHILAILIIILLNSCASINYVQIQIAEPAKEDLPEKIQSLTLVNRSVDERFADTPVDTLQMAFYKNEFNLDTVIYDLTAADTVVKALGDLLYESGRYDIVIPQEHLLPHQKNSFFSIAMPWDEVEVLCDTFHTDAVLSLDHFKTSVSTKYSIETMYDGSEDRYFKAYIAMMAVRYEAIVRIYDPTKKEIINRSVLTDTLIWDDADYSSRALFSRFTKVKSALTEAGVAVALKFSDKISPVWRNETRKFFKTDIPVLNQADTLATKNKWDDAVNIWLSAIENGQTKGKNIKSKLEYNIALGYEMAGDINEAIRWGVKSYNDMYRPVTVEYLNILKKRKEQIDKIGKK